MKSKVFVVILFLGYFLLGLGIYQDYGISFDEHISRNYGIVTYNYITGKSQELMSYQDRRQGIGIELPLYIGERILHLSDIQEVFFYRHLAVFLLFFASTIAFYRILRIQYAPVMSAFGTAILVLHPRIFSNSFYNSKDIGLLSAYIFAVWGIMRFIHSMRPRSALIAGVLTAWTITIRIFGFFLIPITLIVLFADFTLKNRKNMKKKLSGMAKPVGMYVSTVLLCTIVMWPYLWSDPLKRFIETVSEMSQFHWSGTVLYFGTQIPAQHIPWHYSLVWIAITTPVAWIMAFGIGLAFILQAILQNKHIKNLDVLFLLWFCLPLLATIILKSTLYDSWRHMFFLYPAFVGIALAGFQSLFNWSSGKKTQFIHGAIVGIILFLSIRPIWFMIRAHPYQNVYFNRIVGSLMQAKQQFDLDYWGLTFRSGLEYIASQDTSPSIPVFFAYGTINNPNILPAEARSRFVVVDDIKDAKYILSNYRWHPQEYSIPDWYSVTIDGVKIMSVYKVY